MRTPWATCARWDSRLPLRVSPRRSIPQKSQDLVVISESVDAVDVDAKYRYVTLPVVLFENDLPGVLGMTALKNGRDYGTDDEQRFIWLVNAPHPLAAGLAAGIQNVLADEHCNMNWGKPGLGATTIATLLGEPDKAAVLWAVSPPV